MKLIISTKNLIYCIILGVFLVLAGVILGYKIFPSIVSQKVWENSILRENTQQWDLFKKIPFPFAFKVYFFNVENVDDIFQGAKPKVKEIGPYVYKLTRWKDDIEWNEDEINFNEYMRFEFDEKASEPFHDEDEITILNTPYNALLLTIEAMSPTMLESVDPILPNIFNKHNGLFIKDKVKNILFSGQILCENGAEDDFVSKMVCKQFKTKAEQSKGMKIVGNNSINYAYFDFKNNTHQGRFTIKSGQKQQEDIFKLIKFNGETHQKVWGKKTTKCNQIGGELMFRPFVNDSMVFKLFSEDICRNLNMGYESSETIKGIDGLRFAVKNNSLNQPKNEDSCFCVNKSRTMNGGHGCLLDGVLDLTNCLGAPVLLSFPHLLYGDQTYIDSVDGQSPNKTLHDTFVVLEPISGTPLKVAKRVQFNMFIRNIPDVIDIENITNALMPILWLEESVTLDDEYTDKLKKLLLNNLKILEIIKWTLIGIGTIVVLIATGLIMYN